MSFRVREGRASFTVGEHGPRAKYGLGWLLPLVAVAVLALIVACGGSVAPKDVPPVGTIWFGQSFDPKTFVITGKTTSIAHGTPFVLVVNVGRSVKPSDLSMRLWYGGTIVKTQPVAGSGEGDVWGFPVGSLLLAGDFKYEFVDVGGNVLASGTISAT